MPKRLFILLYLLLFGIATTQFATTQEEIFTDFELEAVAEGLTAPHHLVSPPGDARRFIVEQTGQILILDEDGELLEEPFLDVSEKMVVLRATYDERGLLGLAFHPNYADNGRFFVYYSAPLRDEAPDDWDHTSHLAEFTVSDDANRADADSERIIMRIDQPQFNHNGGALAFGPDGYLYVAVGDGGDADDTGIGHPPLGNGQDLTTMLGSILRIDVNSGDPYGIPEDNPFVGMALPEGHPFSGDSIPEEIWAWGFRHPWRMTFDRGDDGVLFVSDAGQNLWEEVSRVTGPNNYGWNLKEGAHWFDPDNTIDVLTEGPTTGHLGEPLIDPVLEYMNNRGREHGVGVVVVGGYMYRGSAIPDLQGHYVFGDWSRFMGITQGVLMVAAPAAEGGLWPWREAEELGEHIMGFGEDNDGEIYVLVNGSSGPVDANGAVYKIVPSQSGNDNDD